jgi:hypothetical protein
MSNPQTWEQEYRRRVTKLLAGVHYEHGFRTAAVEVEGEQGRSWSEITWDPAVIRVTVQGACLCGADVFEWADGPEAVANLLKSITEPGDAT